MKHSYLKDRLDAKEAKQRSDAQNNSLHLYCTNVAEALNDAGLDMKAVLDVSIDIPWTYSSVERFLWKPVQKAVFGTNATGVHKILVSHMAERHGIKLLLPDVLPPGRKPSKLYFASLATELNDAGLDMRRMLKPSTAIPWNKYSVKEYLWKPIQLDMFNKESTTELITKEVAEVEQVLSRHLAEEHGIHVPFPSIEEEMLKTLTNEN